jgi:hypothetical protein
VAERGLAFVQGFSDILAQRGAEGQLPPLFREAWAFSACLSLAACTSKLFMEWGPRLAGGQADGADVQHLQSPVAAAAGDGALAEGMRRSVRASLSVCLLGGAEAMRQ